MKKRISILLVIVIAVISVAALAACDKETKQLNTFIDTKNVESVTISYQDHPEHSASVSLQDAEIKELVAMIDGASVKETSDPLVPEMRYNVTMKSASKESKFSIVNESTIYMDNTYYEVDKDLFTLVNSYLQ